MIQGDITGQGVAASVSGPPVPYVLVRPVKTPANLSYLALEAKRWRSTVQRFRELATARQLPPESALRAQFAEEVLAAAAENLRLGAGQMLVAESCDGRLLGVMMYGLLSPREAVINLLAIDPEQHQGSPGTSQLRGTGTALVAGCSRDLLAKGVETIYLHPLDEQARVFWAGRGFAPCGWGGRLCVRGKDAIAKLIDGCVARPDNGEYVVCGLPRVTEQVRVPAYRA